MKGKLLLTALTAFLSISAINTSAQQLLLLDRFNGNKIVNDSTVTVYGTDPSVLDLTMYFTMKNNTDEQLSLFLRKKINYINDSTIDYFCFGIKCWPDTWTTNYPDTIQAGAEDYTFASHVVHHRRFENPPLPPGKSSITYTIFDSTTFPEPVEASVTVIYHLSGVGLDENRIAASKVFPNPASQQLSIASDAFVSPNYTAYLYNSMGEMVRMHNLSITGKKAVLSLIGLPVGHYFGRLQSDKNIVEFRFVKE